MKNKQKDKKIKAKNRARSMLPKPAGTRANASQPVAGTHASNAPADAAGERLYTAEEIGAKFGVSADEVMAIAAGLGIIGDPRYGRWVPSDTSPHESSEERIPPARGR